MKELRELPLLSEEEITKISYSRVMGRYKEVAQAQREADIKWMKEHCYLIAERKLPKCNPVSIQPKNAYKEAQLDMLQQGWRAVKEFKE